MLVRMPTAAEFRSAALDLDGYADDADVARGRVNRYRGDTGIEGGRFEGDVDRAMDACFLNAGSIAEACRDAAATCRTNAIVCDEYTDAMRRFRSSTTRWQRERSSWLAALDDDPHARSPGPAPAEPARPHPWVEEG